MWNPAQAKSIASEIWGGPFHNGAATRFLTGELRLAIVNAFILRVILVQDEENTITVGAIEDLQKMVLEALTKKAGPTFFGD